MLLAGIFVLFLLGSPQPSYGEMQRRSLSSKFSSSRSSHADGRNSLTWNSSENHHTNSLAEMDPRSSYSSIGPRGKRESLNHTLLGSSDDLLDKMVLEMNSLPYDAIPKCRYHEDLPVPLFHLTTCAHCYNFINAEAFEAPTIKWALSKHPISLHEFNFTIGTLSHMNQTVIANHNDPKSPLLASFGNVLLKRKWKDCCLAAEDCCRRIQKNSDSVNSVSSNDVEAKEEEEVKFCPSTWDGWQCWDSAHPHSMSKAPCPHYIYFLSEPPSCMAFAEKKCNAGVWAPRPNWRMSEWTNYTACGMGKVTMNKNRADVHVIATAISIITIIPALGLFFAYKQLRVHRIILHQNLLMSLLFNCIVVIALKAIMIHEIESNNSKDSIINSNGVGCRLLFILTRYSRMTNYMWMFCEGYYLHKLIAAAFAEQKSLLVFYLIGWVFPIIPTAIYAVIRIHYADIRCWVEPHEPFEWILNGPSLLSLLINMGFLINIIRVLVIKLRAAPQMINSTEPSQYRKAVRATLLLLPLFGLHFVVTLYRPPSGTWGCEWIEAYYYINYILDGLQGFLVSLIFCYLNGEVVMLVKRTYSRVKESRTCDEFSCFRQSHRVRAQSRGSNVGRSIVTQYTSVPPSPEPGSLTNQSPGTKGEEKGSVDKNMKNAGLNGMSNYSNYLTPNNPSPNGGEWTEIKLSNLDPQDSTIKYSPKISNDPDKSTGESEHQL